MGPWSAIRKVVGEESPRRRHLLAKWNELGTVLRQEVSVGREIESYDPDRHAKAHIGTRAWVNQNSAFWAAAGRGGWNLVQGFGSGEVLIRRDLHGVLTSEDLPAYNEKLLEHFKQIGFA